MCYSCATHLCYGIFKETLWFLDALASLRSHWWIEWWHFSDLRITSESIKNIVSDCFNCVNALCRSWKIVSKVVNFDKSFLSAFLHWRRKISHRDIWTPQESKEKFRIENWRRREAKKYKKPVRGVCSSQDWSQKNPLAKRNLFYKSDVLSKHPEMAKKSIQSLKKFNFCNFF